MCRKAQLFPASLSSLPFDSNSVDLVVSTEVLEHLSDDLLREATHEISRVLKPGGRFFVTVPYREQLYHVLCPDCGALFHPAQHLQSFDEARLKELLSEAGLRVDKLKFIPRLRPFKRRSRRIMAAILLRVAPSILASVLGSFFLATGLKVIR